MNHIHKFKNIGSGCMMMEPEGKNCDTDYKCECGVKFRVYTNSIGHRHLPEHWEEEPRSEIKEAEERAIFDAKMGKYPTK